MDGKALAELTIRRDAGYRSHETLHLKRSTKSFQVSEGVVRLTHIGDTYHDESSVRCSVQQRERARVFRDGRSQAVRIPAGFHIGSHEICVRRDSRSGMVKLSERPFSAPAEELFRCFDEFSGTESGVSRDLATPVEQDLF